MSETVAKDADPLAWAEEPDSNPGESRMLADLGLGTWASAAGRSIPHQAALLRAARDMGRIFRLPAPDAPGLAFIGGTTAPARYGLASPCHAPANVSGRGATPEDAFLGCVGEAIEHLSRLEWGDEAFQEPGAERHTDLRTATVHGMAALAAGADATEWLAAVSLHDGRPCAAPADLCLVRDRAGAAPPPSSGCAAGETWEAVCLRAVLELVERDAAALWWCGARPARPLAPDTMAAIGPMASELRGGRTTRSTWFLDITTELDVPGVAALSVDPDGLGLACGIAARATQEDAARAAFLELCQMELANRIVELKLERGGEDALAPVERRHRRRMTEIMAHTSPILAAWGGPRPWSADRVPADPRGQLAWVVEKLARDGIECIAVDLTRPALAVPAVRVLTPLLQGLPVRIETDRLAATLSQNAGRLQYCHSVELI